MALLITNKNRPIFLPAEKAKLLWLVKTGELTGSPEILKLVYHIRKWYLSKDSAPESYLKHNPSIDEQKKQLVLQTWKPYADD
jgi:hypothetical protein